MPMIPNEGNEYAAGDGPGGAVPASTSPADVKADPKKPWKALASFVVSFAGLLWAALEGRDSLANMTAQEWLSVIIPALLTATATYVVPNPKVLANRRAR